MREIKFRAWDMAKKEMMYDYCYLNKGNKFNCYTSTDNIRIIESVMQYTGIKDKDNKEIYEGDLISYWDGTAIEDKNGLIEFKGILGTKYNLKKNQISYIKFAGSSFKIENGFVLLSTYLQPENIKIIGNIYENPELLERDNV